MCVCARMYVYILNFKNCFITLKEHKNKPICRLINPSKTQMGRLEKLFCKIYALC